MTIENTIELAKNGDLNAICSLGQYYMNEDETHKRDIDEAQKWFTVGAEKGNPLCMHLAAAVGLMKAHILRKIYDYPDYNEIINLLNNALSWEKQALEIGYSNEKSDSTVIDIQGCLGIAHYFLSLDSPDRGIFGTATLKELETAICFFKSVYQKTNDKEVPIYFGFAMLDYSMAHKATKSEEILAHSILKESVDNYFDEINVLKVAASHLGVMYTEGIGCERNYDMAVFYFQKAHAAGYDCSDMLRRFKKTLFGGYKLI